MSNEEKTDKSMGHPENYSDMVRIKHWKASKINALKEQITGIEPASSAWEADVLPMNYICLNYQRISRKIRITDLYYTILSEKSK